jgi:hypothetical protein
MARLTTDLSARLWSDGICTRWMTIRGFAYLTPSSSSSKLFRTRSRRYLCKSFPGCLGPCHGGFAECTCLFLPPRQRPSPVHYRGRLPACTRRNDFMTDRFFETAAISLCSGPQVCSPPRPFLPLRLIAAGQPRLLRPSRTCFVASACIGYANHLPRQLVVWGLAPHQIHSLVGCSSVVAIFRQRRRAGRKLCRQVV